MSLQFACKNAWFCAAALSGLVAAQPIFASPSSGPTGPSGVCGTEAEALNQVDKKHQPLLNEKKNAEMVLGRWELNRKRKENELVRKGCRDEKGVKITVYPVPENLAAAKQICDESASVSNAFPTKRKACNFVKLHNKRKGAWEKSCSRAEGKFKKFLDGAYKKQAEKYGKILSEIAKKLAAYEKEKAAAAEALRVCKEKAQGKLITYDFEKFDIGTVFPYGQGFGDEAIAVSVGHFYWLPEGGTDQHPQMLPQAKIEQGWGVAPGGALNKALYPLNATVSFAIMGCATEISFEYSDGGGNVNLIVGEERANVQDFSELKDKTVGGAAVTFAPPPHAPDHDAGTLTLKGNCIKRFGFGGLETLFDNVKVRVFPQNSVTQ